jgi:hypothetical protein
VNSGLRVCYQCIGIGNIAAVVKHWIKVKNREHQAMYRVMEALPQLMTGGICARWCTP